jgi:uncharacterized membrane protein
MNIQAFLILYAISVPVFFLIDMLWLGVIAKSFYQNRIGHLMEVSWVPAIIFYLIFLIGLTLFATYPALSVSSGLKYAFVYGALFGFFTYLTYDMTNLATLKDWPLSMVIVDIAWGTVLGSSVAGLTYYLYSLI